MGVSITKIQFLTNRDSNHPIFYCHSNDQGHNPQLEVGWNGNQVIIFCESSLFKVKKNPQKKNRVDIYMPISSANELGRQLLSITKDVTPNDWRTSTADPNANASGRMALPEILWSKYAKCIRADVDVASGTRMSKTDAYVNVDLEEPHDSFIMMNSREVHIGITLDWPAGTHDKTKTHPVNVPQAELQRGTGETNPVYKVTGNFSMLLDSRVAAGLGELLSGI